ncbi:MAG: phosphate ABC transporter permease PstA [Planctomycetota bacterium]
MSATAPAILHAPPAAAFRPRLRRRRLIGRFFEGLCLAAGLAAVAALAALLIYVGGQGARFVSWDFLTSLPRNLDPERSGIKPALWGTIWLMVLTFLIAVPTGIGAAVYLEEFAPRNRFTRFIHLNIANLAGVPSIVYGILGLALFVRSLLGSRSILAGAMTLSLLVLPVIIIAAREALLAVPKTLREAAYAVGATRWQCVRAHVLPAALPGIMTGIILALSRAIGESAPIIMLGALAFVSFVPGEWQSEYGQSLGGLVQWVRDTLDSPFTALPLQIYNWASRPQEVYRELAAAAILVLLAVLLSMNALATGIRAWQQRHKMW